jgi:hypothetical protein
VGALLGLLVEKVAFFHLGPLLKSRPVVGRANPGQSAAMKSIA